MIDKITIDTVIDRANVVDVISDYIPDLKKSGVNYKCICPFHKDTNPSLVVSPSKNIWHCFVCGKGGNAVEFVMEKEGISFPEAIKVLAKKYNVEVKEDKKKYTTDELDDIKKRESLFIITQAAQQFYAAQIHDNEKSCLTALSYVNHRWNHREQPTDKNKIINDQERDYPSLMGIGFAKGWDSFYRFGLSKGYSEALMEEAGLIKRSSKGNYIDCFHERVTIPIRDKYRHVIGFTCRSIDEDRNPPKYLNSRDSIIYHKGKSIFGIDVCGKQAVSDGVIYCVEGAPDAMQLHSLGVDNTVAGLGTAWTKEMFAQLKRFNCTLCFIPDGDVLKTGQKIATGFQAVMKTGKMAIEEGFRVTVKEIPESKNKQDADSYFKSKAQVYDLSEEDFATWYASKLMSSDDNATARSEKIKEVCSIIVNEKDQLSQDALIDKLGSKYNGKVRWRTALKEVEKVIEKKKAEAISKNSDYDLLEKFGFLVKNNCYYGADGNKQWSNFIMIPLFHIKDNYNAKRIYKMRNVFGITELIELKTEELISLPKFQQRVESLGNFLWMASMDELRRLKEYLYEDTESAEELVQLGWNKAGFFAWGNGIFFDHKFHKVDDFGIVRIERPDDEGHEQQYNYYLPAMSKIFAGEKEMFVFERKFVFDATHSSITLPDYCRMMEKVFGDNAKIGIEFILATLFKDIITSYTKNFPILNLFGPKGSGKSELAHTLEAFFIKDNSPINIQNATIAALSDAIAQCSNAMVHIDEYKNNIDIIKIEFLKGLYDGTGRSKMNMDLDKKRQITRVDSTVVLSGQEMPTVDIALFSRTIYLTFESAVHTLEQKQNFKELSAIRTMGVPHLTNQILECRELVSNGYYETLNEVLSDVNKAADSEIDDRIWRDWSELLAVYKLLQDRLKLPWSYEEMKQLTEDSIKRQNDECSAGNELGSFWDMFQYMVSEGMIYPESDFKIKYTKQLKTNVTDLEFSQDKPVLMMRPKHIILQYKKASKMTGDNTMSERSIRFYLITSKGYLGKKTGSERFKVIVDGQIKKASPVEGGRDIEQFDNPLCFDYTVLKQMYDINLEQSADLKEPEEIKPAKDNTTKSPSIFDGLDEKTAQQFREGKEF